MKLDHSFCKVARSDRINKISEVDQLLCKRAMSSDSNYRHTMEFLVSGRLIPSLFEQGSLYAGGLALGKMQNKRVPHKIDTQMRIG